jgi:hypothetical protein
MRPTTNLQPRPALADRYGVTDSGVIFSLHRVMARMTHRPRTQKMPRSPIFLDGHDPRLRTRRHQDAFSERLPLQYFHTNLTPRAFTQRLCVLVFQSEAWDAGGKAHVPKRLFLLIGTSSFTPRKSRYFCCAVYTRLSSPAGRPRSSGDVGDKRPGCRAFVEP